MNERVFEHVKKYNESKGYGTTEEDIIETIREAKEVYKDSGDKHRWYIIYWIVVEVNGMFIGFCDADCTGDEGTEDSCPFDPSTICECEAKEKTVIVYERKN